MASRKTSRQSAPRATAASRPVVSVSWPGAADALVGGAGPQSDEIYRQAPWWNYALLHRERWRGTEALNVAQQSRALHLWKQVFRAGDGASGGPGLPPQTAPMAEVAIRYDGPQHDWHYRILPWEFVMNSVIRAHHPHELRDAHRLPVLRRLVPAGAAPSWPECPRGLTQWKVLVVLSAPGFISRAYHLKSELESIEAQLEGAQIEALWTPTLSQIQEKIGSFQPHIVHFAGCDIHQARAIPEQTRWTARERELMLAQLGPSLDSDNTEGTEEPDGYVVLAEDSEVMHGDAARLECVRFDRLPALFRQHRPALVCWNLYHSGNRIAALCVGEGHVGAAIGFQDFIDDELAEEYFDEFYRGLRDGAGRVAIAHVRGLNSLWRLPGSIRGSGIVLWTGPSRLEEFGGLDPGDAVLQPTALQPHQGDLTDDQYDIDIEVPPGLNYAQLHQKQYPFERFRIFLRKPWRLNGLQVEVKLNGEDRELAYRRQINVDAPFADLSGDIEFPLTSPIARACGESVVTTLYVKISCGDRVLHSHTYATRLLPADQWRFSNRSAHTLASFVFPRDPAIEALVLEAQKYVRVLRDDALAGFEGYQAETPEEVDLQIRALWYALVHEHRLGYINPPPAYSAEADSQRLRTPSMVLKGGWGTCIDLSLLLAAAYELIDVYAVIVVLKAHAFVGYWRSAEGRERFLEMSESAELDDTWSFLPRRPVNGMFLSTSLKEILYYVDSGDLVLIESTLLTRQGGFDDAVACGQENLSDAEQFDYMIDLMSARSAQITPLPLSFA